VIYTILFELTKYRYNSNSKLSIMLTSIQMRYTLHSIVQALALSRK